MEKKFQRDIGRLEGVFSFIADFCALYRIDDSQAFYLNLAVEELFTNLVKYNQGGGDHILLHLERSGDRVVMRLTDYDVEPFDGSQASPVNTVAPLTERKPGGLGLHLVKSVTESLTYEYVDGAMRITAVKRLEENDV